MCVGVSVCVCVFACVARLPHRDGEEPRVPVHPPGAGPPGAGAQRLGGAAGGARGLELRPEGAAGEAGDRHQAGDGEEVEEREREREREREA